MKRARRLALHVDPPRKQLKREAQYCSLIKERNAIWFRFLWGDAWDDRSFLGYLTTEQAQAQEKAIVIDENALCYFCYFSDSFPGDLIMKYVAPRAPAIHWLRTSDMETARSFLNHASESYNLGLKPLDRGRSIVFKKATRQFAGDAVYAWLVYARKLGLCKDVARLIAHFMLLDYHLWLP